MYIWWVFVLILRALQAAWAKKQTTSGVMDEIVPNCMRDVAGVLHGIGVDCSEIPPNSSLVPLKTKRKGMKLEITTRLRLQDLGVEKKCRELNSNTNSKSIRVRVIFWAILPDYSWLHGSASSLQLIRHN